MGSPKFGLIPEGFMRLRLSPTCWQVLIWILVHVDKQDTIAAKWCSSVRIAADTDLDDGKVRSALGDLIQRKVISRTEDRARQRYGIKLNRDDIEALRYRSASESERFDSGTPSAPKSSRSINSMQTHLQTQGEEEISDQVVTDQSGGVTPAPAAAPKTLSPDQWKPIVALGYKYGFYLDCMLGDWMHLPECEFMFATVASWTREQWEKHLAAASKCENWKRTGKRWKSPSVLRMIIDSVCQIPVGSEDTQWGDAWV